MAAIYCRGGCGARWLQLMCTCGYCHVNQISYFASTLIPALAHLPNTTGYSTFEAQGGIKKISFLFCTYYLLAMYDLDLA